MRDWMRRFIEEHRDERGDLEPPWARYPTLRAGSIGWRMGSGESWLSAWSRFVADLDDEALVAYLGRHPSAPVLWQRFLASILSDRLLPSELQGHAWVRPDAAFPVYVRNELREGGVRAPWCWRRADTVATLVRHHVRQLAFWGRWCAVERAEGRLDAWLQAQPPAPEPWRPVVEALQRLAVPDEPHELWLACSLAAHGEPEPPWQQDIAPPERQSRAHGDLERSDVWFRWVLYTFDDASTYQDYLQRRPPREDWQAQLEDWFPWLQDGYQSVDL